MASMTEYLPTEVTSVSRLHVDGRPTKARNASLGDLTANLGNIVSAFVKQENAGTLDDIAIELKGAKRAAWDEVVKANKKGTAALNQGKTTYERYQNKLQSKLIEVEKKHPGFASDIVAMEESMGLTPVSKLAERQAKREDLNEKRLYAEMNSVGAIVRDRKTGEVMVPESFNRLEDIKEAAAVAAETRRIGMENGMSPAEKGQPFTRNLAKNFSKIRDTGNNTLLVNMEKATTMLNELATKPSAERTAVLQKGLNDLVQGYITDNLKYRMGFQHKGDLAALAELHKEQEGYLNQLVTGDPAKVESNITLFKQANTLVKESNVHKVHHLMPTLSAFTDALPPQIAQQFFTSLGINAETLKLRQDVGKRLQGELTSGVETLLGTTIKTYTDPPGVGIPFTKVELPSAIQVSSTFLQSVATSKEPIDWTKEGATEKLWQSLKSFEQASRDPDLNKDSYKAMSQYFNNPRVRSGVGEMMKKYGEKLGGYGAFLAETMRKASIEEIYRLSPWRMDLTAIRVNPETGQFEGKRGEGYIGTVTGVYDEALQWVGLDVNTLEDLNKLTESFHYYSQWTNMGELDDTARMDLIQEEVVSMFNTMVGPGMTDQLAEDYRNGLHKKPRVSVDISEMMDRTNEERRLAGKTEMNVEELKNRTPVRKSDIQLGALPIPKEVSDDLRAYTRGHLITSTKPKLLNIIHSDKPEAEGLKEQILDGLSKESALRLIDDVEDVQFQRKLIEKYGLFDQGDSE